MRDVLILEFDRFEAGGESAGVDERGAARRRLRGAPATSGGGPLLRAFGAHLFGRLAARYPVFLAGTAGVFDFLAEFETGVAGAVRALDASATPPLLRCRLHGTRLEISYESPRELADLAEGLLCGCVAWFGEPLRVVRQGGARGAVRFRLEPDPLASGAPADAAATPLRQRGRRRDPLRAAVLHPEPEPPGPPHGGTRDPGEVRGVPGAGPGPDGPLGGAPAA